jgi:hypothetical protein
MAETSYYEEMYQGNPKSPFKKLTTTSPAFKSNFSNNYMDKLE